MGSINRQLKRKKQLEKRKQAKRKAKNVENQINSMPSKCAVCDSDFNTTDRDMLNQWRIAVWDDGRIELTCPSCGPTPDELEAFNMSKNENS